MFANPAGFNGGPAQAVGTDAIQGASNDSRRGGLAHAAHPGQDESMRDTLFPYGIGDGADQRLLTHQLAKILRAIFPRQYPIGGVVI